MLRWLLGEDFFISYSRGDGLAYAAALGNALAAQGFSCFLDQWGSEPGREIPPRILRSLDRSSMLVLVGTPAAARSVAVEREVRRFLKTQRGLVPISFEGSLETSAWFDTVAGAAISSETLEALGNGRPSQEVLGRVANSFVFTRRNQRVRHAFIASGVGLVALAAAAGTATYQARREQAAAAVAEVKALEQQRLADEARTEATTQQARAKTESARANAAAASAAQAEQEARQQQALAVGRLRVARAAEWAGAARTLAATDSDLSALLAVRAYREANTFDARRGLLAALAERPLLKSQLVSAQPITWSGGSGVSTPVRGLWFDFAGRRLAVQGAQGSTIKVFNLDRTGRPQLLGDGESLGSIAPSPDLSALAGVHGTDGFVRIRRSGQPEVTLIPGDSGTSRLAWSPDGTRLAIGSERGVRVWSGLAPNSPSSTAQTAGPTVTGFLGETSSADASRRHGVNALDFSADGRTVHWQTRSGQRLAATVDDGKPAEPLLEGVPGRRWLSSGSQHLVLYNGVLRLVDGHAGSRAGQSAASDGNHQIEENSRTLLSEPDRARDVQAAAIDASGTVAAAVMRDGLLRLFVNGTEVANVRAHVRPASAVAVSQDGRLVATGAEDGSVLLWELRPGRLPQWAGLPPDWRASSATLTMGLAWSRSGGTIWAAGESGVTAIDAETWQTIRGDEAVLHCGDTVPASLLTLPDGRLLVGGRPHRLHVVDARRRSKSANSGGATATRCGPPLVIEQRNRWDTLTVLALSPDGRRVLSGDAAGQLVLWDLERRLAELPAGAPKTIQVSSRSAIMGLLWRPDGYVMEGEVATNTKPPPVPRSPAYAPREGQARGDLIAGDRGSRLIAQASGDVVSLLDGRSGRELVRWSLRPVPLLGIEQLAMDPRERWLAAGHRAGVTLIDLETRQTLGILPLPGGCPDCRPLSLAFSPDGKWLAALLPGGVVRWPVAPELWVYAACAIAAEPSLQPGEAASYGIPTETVDLCR